MVGDTTNTLSRRDISKNAAWALPVVAVALATPAAAASGSVDVGAFQLVGDCALLGLVGPGFSLRSSSAAMPAGTTIRIQGRGIAQIGVLSVDGGVADVSVLGDTGRLVTLGADLPAGAALTMRTALSLSVAFTLRADAALPVGYVGTGAKTSATVSSTAVLCFDS